MDISVLITTYNRAALLTDLLEALSTQNVPGNIEWEVIVVDNNSNDNTHDVVENAIKRFPAPIRYVFEPCQGQCHARNRGISESDARVVAFTDDDVIPDSNWVVNVWKAMEETAVDGVGGRILPKWEDHVPRWLARKRHLWGYLALMESAEMKPITLPPQPDAKIWGANMAFRRSVFEQVGNFETAIGNRGTKLYRGDETELVQRALERGKKFIYHPALIVYHRVGSDRMRRSYFRKVVFDGGERQAISSGKFPGVSLFGAPVWLYRLCATEFGQWLAHVLLAREQAFERELDFLDDLGKIWGLWKMGLKREPQ